MSRFVYILLSFVLACCQYYQPTAPGEIVNKEVPPGNDTILTFNYKLNIHDKNIRNNSEAQVDILFNGVDGFLGGRENMAVRFNTECMMCEPVQKFDGGLLFAKRLLFKPGQATYFRKDIDIPDTVSNVHGIGFYGERTKQNFKFEGGTATMNYLGQSCNDADFDKVQLHYKKGTLIIDSIINATFFDFDLDADGTNEQYLYGTRNCSQELVFLRIRR